MSAQSTVRDAVADAEVSGMRMDGERRIHTEAQAAWLDFCERSGLERDGRDADLMAELSSRLGCSPERVDETVADLHVSDLGRLLFKAVAPFAEMCRDIVRFFREAGGARSRETWAVALADEDLDLREFERFVEILDGSQSVVSCAALDLAQAWTLCRELEGLARTWRASVPPDARRWIAAYRAGSLPSIPSSLASAAPAGALSEARAVFSVALAPATARSLGRAALARIPWWTGSEAAADTDLVFTAGLDSDHWFERCLAALSALIAAELPESDVKGLGAQLERFPRRSLLVEADAPLLQRIAEMPVWRRRHEVYAVWIATEIRRALPHHPVEIHDRSGRLDFSFTTTRLATIGSSHGDVALFGERRVPLDRPLGPSRSAGAQPDYGLWRGVGSDETCALVIEVKHYKRGAARPFAEMFVDYARAHPQATVAMASHGPAGRTLERAAGLDPAAARRCVAFGGLTPLATDVREAFARCIRTTVGPPPLDRGPDALVVDVSGSMRPMATSRMFRSWLAGALEDVGCGLLVDTQVRWRGRASELQEALDAFPFRGGTDLGEAVDELRSIFRAVRVATDWSGYEDLRRRFGRETSARHLPEGLVEATITGNASLNGGVARIL